MELKDYNSFGGYNPSKLKWDETISFPSTRKLLEYGNRIYNRYPARSIFLVPRATIHHKKKANSTLNILDPFMGSGTTAVESIVQNCNIYGTEMDPFARLIAEVSIYRFSKKELTEIESLFNEIKLNWETYPIDKTLYPKLNNVEYWFEENIFTDLLRLKSYLYHNIKKEKYLKFFQITFADCIKPSSKMERQSTKPYISSKYKKAIKPVIESFEYSYKAHLKASCQYELLNTKSTEGKINWLGSDATNFNTIKDIIDVAITSPPYLNAFDYTQIIKIESAWLGTLVNSEIEELRLKQVGHEKRRHNEINPIVEKIFKPYFNKIIKTVDIHSKKNKINCLTVAKTCLSYFNDMLNNLTCVKDVLKKGGEYHLVIGDNVIQSIEIPTHKIIAEIAQAIDFKWVGYYKYAIKDHRTSIPRKDNGGKIKYEYVIILKK